VQLLLKYEVDDVKEVKEQKAGGSALAFFFSGGFYFATG
jgi:hypothetical protein